MAHDVQTQESWTYLVLIYFSLCGKDFSWSRTWIHAANSDFYALARNMCMYSSRELSRMSLWRLRDSERKREECDLIKVFLKFLFGKLKGLTDPSYESE